MSSIESAFHQAFKLHQEGNLPRAETLYRQVLVADAANVSAWNNLGNVLKDQGRFAEAVGCYRQALQIHSAYLPAHYNLGVALTALGELGEAVVCFQRVLAGDPSRLGARQHLGALLLDERLYAREPLASKRTHYQAVGHYNCAVAYFQQGRLADAVDGYRKALALNPSLVAAHTNLIFALLYCHDVEPETLFDEQRRWQELHARPLAAGIKPHRNDKTPERRLRIGYVSPDFCFHPVGRYMLPLLEAHAHERYEIFCYASVAAPDAMTDRLQAHADVWRSVAQFTHQELADLIQQDEIDILVDLTMHMAGSRLSVFARKPAPVQVTYLAYPGTTGLDAIDYRLTDNYLDPPDAAERFYSEKSIRLPGLVCCYEGNETPVAPLPALTAGHVTFGCLNSFLKITPPTLATWCALLAKMPSARLLLHADAAIDHSGVTAFFSARHIAADRVRFVGKLPAAAYFETYGQIDIALDPFPYGGGTTTLDALWMGVPVVSLVGAKAVGRQGLTILANLGLPELAAANEEQYQAIALALANDLPRLNILRTTLRERMRKSPVMDAASFTRNIEAAYRAMWRNWCESPERSL
jgi:protein O-GlcNAc transferase